MAGSIGTWPPALDGLEGIKKPAPGKPGAGTGGIQDFFAVSQMIIKGRARINRIIKRGSPPLDGERPGGPVAAPVDDAPAVEIVD